MEEMTVVPATTAGQTLLREGVREDGCVLLRGLFPGDEVRRIAQQARAELVAGGWLSDVGPNGRALRHVKPWAEPEDFWPVFGRILALESLNSLAWDDRLVGPMSKLLGDGAFPLPMKTPRVVFPSLDDDGTPVHRDNRTGAWAGDMCISWVALEDVPREVGGLAILRGSHTYADGPLPYRPSDSADASRVARPDSPDWVTADYRAGDVVIFHSYCVHRSLPNTGSGVRISVDYRWKVAGEPLHVSALMPHRYFNRYPFIPTWAELTAGWHEDRWCSYPVESPVTYSRFPDGVDGTVPASRMFPLAAGAHELWEDDDVPDGFRMVPFAAPRSQPVG